MLGNQNFLCDTTTYIHSLIIISETQISLKFQQRINGVKMKKTNKQLFKKLLRELSLTCGTWMKYFLVSLSSRWWWWALQVKVGMGAALTRQSSHPISPVAALHPPPLPPMPSSPARVDMPASVGASAGGEKGDLLTDK